MEISRLDSCIQRVMVNGSMQKSSINQSKGRMRVTVLMLLLVPFSLALTIQPGQSKDWNSHSRRNLYSGPFHGPPKYEIPPPPPLPKRVSALPSKSERILYSGPSHGPPKYEIPPPSPPLPERVLTPPCMSARILDSRPSHWPPNYEIPPSPPVPKGVPAPLSKFERILYSGPYRGPPKYETPPPSPPSLKNLVQKS